MVASIAVAASVAMRMVGMYSGGSGCCDVRCYGGELGVWAERGADISVKSVSKGMKYPMRSERLEDAVSRKRFYKILL